MGKEENFKEVFRLSIHIDEEVVKSLKGGVPKLDEKSIEDALSMFNKVINKTPKAGADKKV